MWGLWASSVGSWGREDTDQSPRGLGSLEVMWVSQAYGGGLWGSKDVQPRGPGLGWGSPHGAHPRAGDLEELRQSRSWHTSWHLLERSLDVHSVPRFPSLRPRVSLTLSPMLPLFAVLPGGSPGHRHPHRCRSGRLGQLGTVPGAPAVRKPWASHPNMSWRRHPPAVTGSAELRAAVTGRSWGGNGWGAPGAPSWGRQDLAPLLGAHTPPPCSGGVQQVVYRKIQGEGARATGGVAGL